ncbi:hypothetical protein SAMN04487886_104920 [Clostridium sp. DSM 8431]|nr:hypothetical protein SAMN04487886_104920 [Clostridium sp. DSM 8431]
MNREEKAKYDNEISNKFVAGTNYDDSELEALSI